MASATPAFIFPDWPAPENIRTAFTTRIGGFSQAPCDAFNLGLHVGDDAANVARNRQLLADALALPAPPVFLNQVHGTDVLSLDFCTDGSYPAADACWTKNSNHTLAIMTADCLPVLFASTCGAVIAGAHAGWRGLADGVLENTVAKMPVPSGEIIAWLGPAIGPQKFEVGAEVRACFVRQDASCDCHFESVQTEPGKYLANLYGLAKDRLLSAGIASVYGGNHCTYSDSETFFSHRRDAGKTGRMAALIWKVR